ncbi:MAG: LCP family protein [Oscillospiraceae bacterium]|nr:LCP family protein [Oscillospiraceae bacterium]
MFKDKNPLIYLIAIVAVIVMGGGVGFFLSQINQGNTVVRNEGASSVVQNDYEPDDSEWEDTIMYDGKRYKKNENISTVLVMGVDTTVSAVSSGLIGNNGRTDFMILLLVDKKAKTIQMLELSRDTMVEVDAYNNDGKLIYSGLDHLTMQYSYGNSPASGCRLTRDKISHLLYDTPIDHYLSLTIEGMKAVVDLMGGISLTMPEDYSYIEPAYTKGATVLLDSQAVERFVRYRDTKNFGSSEVRMERHNWFLIELFRQMKNDQNKIGVDKILSTADPYLETDLDAEAIQKIMGSNLDENSKKVPGESKAGEFYDEYYVDETALQELLVDLFYLPVDE